MKRDKIEATAIVRGVTRLADLMREDNAAKMSKIDEGIVMFREYLDIKKHNAGMKITETNLVALQPLDGAAMKKTPKTHFDPARNPHTSS